MKSQALQAALWSNRRLSGVIVAAIVLYELIVALVFAAPQQHVVNIPLTVALGLAAAAAPVLVLLAVRYPLIFPFGVFVLLAPLDQGLYFSSTSTVTKLVAIFGGAALLFNILLIRRACVPPRAWFAWLLLVAWMGISLLWVSDLENAKWLFVTILDSFILLTVLAVYPVRELEFSWLLVLYVGAGLLGSGWLGFEFMQGTTPNHFDRFSITFANGDIMIDPNDLAASLLLPWCIALSAALFSRRLLPRLAAAASIPFITFGIFLTGSRGGATGLLIALLWFAWRTGQRVKLLIVGALALSLSAFFPNVWYRFLNDPSHAESGSGRTDIWATGLHLAKDHWLIGSGIGTFPDMYDKSLTAVYQVVFQGFDRPSHSLLIGTLVELGLVGVVLVISAWYLTFRQLEVVQPSSPRHWVRVALEAGLAGLFWEAMFIDVFFLKYYWLAYSIVLVLSNVEQPRFFGAMTSARSFEQRQQTWPVPLS